MFFAKPLITSRVIQMKLKKIRKKSERASSLFSKGKIARAYSILSNLRAVSSSEEAAACLDYHQGTWEEQSGNTEKALSLFASSAQHGINSKDFDHASMTFLRLGKLLSSDGQYDKACEAFLNAEKYTDIPDRICEIKACLSEARMASDTVYETRLFTEPCEYINSLATNDITVKPNYFIRIHLVAAQACEAMNIYTVAADFCTDAIEHSLSENDDSTLEKAFQCAVLLCDCAVQTWDSDFISKSAKTAYKIALRKVFDKDKNHRITLLYALTLIKKGEILKARNLLSAIDENTLDAKNKICFDYCRSLCEDEQEVFELSNQCKEFIPKNNIDDLSVFTEAIISNGFPEVAAKIYAYALEFYPHCRQLVLRPYASLLFRLEEYEKCAECYSELAEICDEPVLNRTYSLASLRCGDVDTAKKQMLIYIDKTDNKEDALTIAGNLSLSEGYPPEFSASLYAKLAEILEKKGISTYETVDTYNRLGIALFRCESPLEAEMSAFKKASVHADACENTHNTNLHAVILCNLAECYMRDGDINKCFDAFSEAEKIFADNENVDLLQYTSCLKFKADIYIIRGDEERAAESLKKAVELLEPNAENDPSIARQLSLCLNALGTIYFKMGKPELEIPELTKAISLVKDLPVDDASLALLYSNRGEAYERTGKYDLMAEDYSQYIYLSQNSEQTDNETRLSHAAKWLSIGRYREDILKHNDAIRAYKSALDILNELPVSEEHETNELTAFAYYQLGNAYCHGNVKDFSSSLFAYSRSLTILEGLPTTPSRKLHLASTYDARASFYEVFGEHTLAVHDFEKAEELRNSIIAELN